MCKTIVHLLMWSEMTPKGEPPLKAGFEEVVSRRGFRKSRVRHHEGCCHSTSLRHLACQTSLVLVEAICAPFQFAVSTPALVDCVGHAVRVATDQNTEAYDHVLRSSMMSKLRDTPSLQGLWLFVRTMCSRPSCYKWTESSGTCCSFAFLDDVYVVCSPNRVRAVFDLLARELSEHVGIQPNEGKTSV